MYGDGDRHGNGDSTCKQALVFRDPGIVRTLHRFAAENSRNQLPVWVRPSVKVYDKFGLALKDLMVFFKTAEKTVWKVFFVANIII